MEITVTAPQRSRNGQGDEAKTSSGQATLRFALAGQPNVGKSTIFNMLTGMDQHVGNWPGKTIERKEGRIRLGSQAIELVDLPGAYSLTANSPEESLARDFIIRERPDVVIAIVNASSLERNLYLVAELLQLPVPVVLGLNMLDVAQRNGIQVEPHVLEAALCLPVIPLVATRNQGLRELLQAAVKLAQDPTAFHPCRPYIPQTLGQVQEELRALIAPHVPEPYPPSWVATKLLEGDRELVQRMQEALPREVWEQAAAILREHEDAFLEIASGRYQWIERMVRAAMVRPSLGPISLTDRLDRVLTHPLWGLLALSGAFGLVFWLTYTLATPIQSWLDAHLVQWSGAQVRLLLAGAPGWLVGLLADGVIGGVGTVLTFVPILLIFFAALGLLEDVGYLSRAAFVMDRAMQLIGLRGKSFLPLFLGFGCNVPAIMGARIIEEKRTRLLTILLAPLVPCTARLAVLAFLAPAFFGAKAALVTWGLVTLNLLVLVGLGMLARLFLPAKDEAAFIMELPLYHLPNRRTIGLFVWQNTLAFVKNAGTTILLFSVLVWFLSSVPSGDPETSLLAGIGRALAPVSRWLGWTDWRLTAALLSSFAAKENTIATLGILYPTGQGAGELASRVAQSLPVASSVAFLVVQMLFIPCAATVAAIRQETGSWRWSGLSVALLLVVSFGVGAGAYHLLSLLGLGV